MTLLARDLTSSYDRRAALRAALSALGSAMLIVPYSSPLSARMRSERLVLVTGKGERAVDVEIAETVEEQMLGLMYRTSLADEKGMLFVHPQARELTMWMKNTYISLDMVFIRADGVVHRIAARTEPLSETIIPSQGPVSAVLELAGGAAERLGVKPGDTVRHPHFKNMKPGR